jgi:hypothetical protein
MMRERRVQVEQIFHAASDCDLPPGMKCARLRGRMRFSCIHADSNSYIHGARFFMVRAVFDAGIPPL